MSAYTEISGLYDRVFDRFEGEDLISKSEVLQMIAKAPVADVEEVKRGQWLEHYSFGGWHYDCPFCDDGFATKEKDTTPPARCQTCGAIMDGAKEGVK